MAQLYLKQDKAKSALTSLEQSLSHSFEIKESPFYLLIKARVHEELGENEEALKLIETAMELPGVKSVPLSEKKRSQNFSHRAQISTYDRVSLYLELANIYTKLNNNVVIIGEVSLTS
jgi:tetratricopeptide repeat protein 21B